MTSENRGSDSRDHLFVSYAWEDGALAEWLTLKLTAEGYRVWCDRFKILGGERWPDDIDAAIRGNTFRMLHLVSKHSLHKPNPKKERELALQLERERGSEILIPLNVDGTKPSELPWRIVDVAYIPFQNWHLGFRKLLKKLDAVKAPRPNMDNGRQVAAHAFLVPSAIKEEEDNLLSNLFPFTSVPRVIRHFRFPRRVIRNEESALHVAWVFRSIGGTRALAFGAPPASFGRQFLIEETGRAEWREGETVAGVPAEHLVSELLGKSLDLYCRTRGLVRDQWGRSFYFPFGLLGKNTLKFEGYGGKQTRVLACGYRRFNGRRFCYHLAPLFRVRHEHETGFLAQLRLRLHLSDERGATLDRRAEIARRKKIGSAWWNGEWLNRQIAVMSFLADGQTEIRIGGEPEAQVVLAASPMSGFVDRSIDEMLLATIGAPAGLEIAMDDVIVEEAQ